MPALPAYRIFIAIELPHDIRARIVEHIALLRREFPDVRASWLREDNLHLTLKFLGDIPVADVPKLSDAAERAAQSIDPFELTVSGSGTFPPRGRPTVLWIGIESEPPAVAGGPAPGAQASSLQVLHASLEDRCATAGFKRDPRPFHPHLTIARLRSSKGSRHLADLHKEVGFSQQPFPVSEIVVSRSELLPDRSKHTPISCHKVAGR